MAEGFDFEHVPRQIRRDKLRCVEDLQLQGCVGLLPIYDPSSLISSHLLACANQNTNQDVKEVPMTLMGNYPGVGIINASNSSNSSSSYMDPQSSLHNIQDLNNNNNQNHTFLYNPQNLRLLDHHQQNFNDQLVVYKPEPLSLSLSSHNTHNTNQALELNLQRYESTIYSGGGGGGYYCRSTVPLGPFTGYASILKGSRFLKPAQQLLEEICDVGCGIYGEKFSVDSALMDSPLECLSRSGFNVDDPKSGGDKRKKSRLIFMLDEVYKRYKQYYQQIQAVIASFETVAGLSNAAPFANLDIKAMSKHFRCLKNAITDQLQFTTKQHINFRKEETVARSGSSDRGIYGQRAAANNLGFVDHQPVWRPQRGLPERAVTVLRAWLFDHFLHPYPSDTDKLMLAKQAGLSRNQVSNWFINARVRLWKPMVEEIHTLETRQVQKASHEREEQDEAINRTNDHNLPPPSTLAPGNPPRFPQRMQDPPSKRTRNDFSSNLIIGSVEPMNLLYDDLSRHRQLGTLGGNAVSLTLGLHQNNGPAGLSDPFPINSARRFGLDASSDQSFVMSGLDAQNRQFGREIIGGQLLHDFVG